MSTSTARLPHGGKEPVATKLVIVVVSLAILTFLGILSETSLNIAYSTLMEEFSISASVVQWLTTGYLLLLSVSIPSSPFMVRKFATKTLFIMAIAIFTAGTVLGALALLPGAVLGAVSATVVGGMLKRHSVPDHCGSAAAGRVACHMAVLSMAWILQHPEISCVIAGASKPGQLENNLKASGFQIPADAMAGIDRITGFHRFERHVG